MHLQTLESTDFTAGISMEDDLYFEQEDVKELRKAVALLFIEGEIVEETATEFLIILNNLPIKEDHVLSKKRTGGIT